jgi:hypothetical protein
MVAVIIMVVVVRPVISIVSINGWFGNGQLSFILIMKAMRSISLTAAAALQDHSRSYQAQAPARQMAGPPPHGRAHPRAA